MNLAKKRTDWRQPNKMNEFEEQDTLSTNRLINTGLFLIVILTSSLLISLYVSRKPSENNIKVVVEDNVFASINLEAKSAIVYDINNNRTLFQKNADVILPLASITKVLSVITALDLLPNNAIVVINTDFLKESGDSGLYGQEKWKLDDLIDFSLTSSSNDGIAAIAGAAGAIASGTNNLPTNRQDFVLLMNEKAKKIGMRSSYFRNETGLDISPTLSGAYSSAREVAALFMYALKERPEIFQATTENKFNLRSLNNIVHKVENTNDDVNKIPGLIASKTGYTDLAGGNLAIAFDAGINRPIIVVVMGSSENGRFNDVLALTRETYDYIKGDGSKTSMR